MVKRIKIERTVYENLGDLANLLITLAVKVTADKVWDTKWCTKWYTIWSRYMKEEFMITSSNYRKPVWSIFTEEN